METEKRPFWTRALEVLSQGPFCRYIVGSAISDTGTWMQVMAQAWVMSSLTNKAILLGMVNFAAGLPTLALTMIGGAAADRFDKRMILIATQVVQIALALLLGWLVLTNRIHIWHILAVAALLGVSIAFEMPAISALVPELVKRDQIATAVALDRSVFHGSRLVGPSIAGVIVAWWGAAWQQSARRGWPAGRSPCLRPSASSRPCSCRSGRTGSTPGSGRAERSGGRPRR